MDTPPDTGFDINEGGGARLPAFSDIAIKSVDMYAGLFSQVMADTHVGAFLKALDVAPSMQTYGKMSMLPGTWDRGVLQWPGVQPQVLKKVSEENLIIHAVMQQRLADIDRFCSESTQIWRPGWQIELMESRRSPTDVEWKAIEDARWFIRDCNTESRGNARLRDSFRLSGFRNFCKALLRDSLRYDFATTWTDMGAGGAVRAFKALPAANIALCVDRGFEDDPRIFAVGRDEAGTIIERFTRERLSIAVRNPRTDADVGGYGYSELEMTIKISAAFTNAFDMNADIFTRSGVPNGFLMLEGMFNQKQTEALSRIWSNMRKGPSKQFTLPAVNVPKDGKISVVDLSAVAGKDGLYRDYSNMMAGLYCAITNFPVHRLGYHASGGMRDEASDRERNDGFQDRDDPALGALLDFLETFINEYLIWPRWPSLQLRFNGKNPKEDARAYEARKNASTIKEMRWMSDLPDLTDLVEDAEMKKVMGIMEMAPVDPGEAGIFQTIASALLGKENGESGIGPEARMRPKNDPATAEDHGAVSGVRRNSAAEKMKSDGPQESLYLSRPVINLDDIRAWAASQGFPRLVEDLHCTVLFSRDPVDWFALSESTPGVEIVGGARRLEYFGDALVLRFTNSALGLRHQAWRAAGASSDYDTYKPHITLAYDGEKRDLSGIAPYPGPIILGAEVFAPVKEDWKNYVRQVDMIGAP